jgi:hypothetical protein
MSSSYAKHKSIGCCQFRPKPSPESLHQHLQGNSLAISVSTSSPTITTGTVQGADGRDLCRWQNVGAVGTVRGSGRLRQAPSAQKSRRHSRSYADGHRRPRSDPRHKFQVTIGTRKPSAQPAAMWAQIFLLLTV